MSLSCIERRQSACGSLVEGEGRFADSLSGWFGLSGLSRSQPNEPKKLNKPEKPDGPDSRHVPRNV